MRRKDELEELLNCKIYSRIIKGESLEKYHASLHDREVLLRIYTDSYYTNRFLREGMVLRQLSETDQVTFPSIIDEWPEHNIRAIQWMELEEIGKNVNTSVIFEWLKGQEVSLPFSLKTDLIPHLRDTDSLHQAYKDYFEEHLNTILDEIMWNDGNEQLIHGDLHNQNIGLIDDTQVIYDWEYATIGSEWYDKAYYSILEETTSTEVPNIWLRLVAAVNAHWFLQEDRFSPKDAIKWINKLGELA